MKSDEHVIIGIYPHESKDLVSIVVLSNDGNIQVRSVMQYEGLEAINFLDDLKNKPLWKYVDVCVLSENYKAKEISSKLELENKSVIPVYLTPRKFFDVYGSKKFSDFSVLLNYITEKNKVFGIATCTYNFLFLFLCCIFFFCTNCNFLTCSIYLIAVLPLLECKFHKYSDQCFIHKCILEQGLALSIIQYIFV